MVPIEGDVVLSPIHPGDIPDALALVAEAGWNQTEADWRFMLSAGRGVGIRDQAGRLIASSMVLCYRAGIGWIGMVLVSVTHRNRGHATRLLREAIRYCQTAGLVPMLDATPAGRKVYERLDFADGDVIERWRGVGGGSGERFGHFDLDRAVELDRLAFGADRAGLIADLVQRDEGLCFQLDAGVLLGRRGRTATQMGPLLADDEATALTLCERAIAATAGALLIDVPVRELALRRMLKARGFVVERPFTRMSLGPFPAMGRAMRAIAGPELG